MYMLPLYYLPITDPWHKQQVLDGLRQNELNEQSKL